MFSILLVDDEKAIREYLPQAIPFEQHGFAVKDTAMNGQEALEKLPSVQPDLILLDVRMPVMDGLEFLNQLRKGSYSEVLVVMLSGYSDFSYAKQAMKYGVKAYLNKPVDEEEIIPLLKELYTNLERQRQRQRNMEAFERLNLLWSLYKGGTEDREALSGHALMTCVLFPGQRQRFASAGEAYHLLLRALGEVIKGPENYLFRSRGSWYTFLLTREVLEQWHGELHILSRKLTECFGNFEIDCSVGLDSCIFDSSSNRFREDFLRHQQEILTQLFYFGTGYPIYAPGQFPIGDKMELESKFMEGIRQHFLPSGREELAQAVDRMKQEAKRCRLDVYRAQEVSLRVYYLILQELELSQLQEEGGNILTRPDLMEAPYFIGFDKWAENLMDMLEEGLSFMERRHEMVKLGISREIIEYVHLHYTESINLKQIADLYYVNATYLGRAFQKATGVNFKQYVNNIRINEAKRLLLHTDKMIYEIANEVGYAESKYFVVKFSQEVGMSPTEYRKQN